MKSINSTNVGFLRSPATLLLVLIFFIPFMQMGVSYYLSVQVGLFIILFFAVEFRIILKNLPMFIIVLSAMLISTLFYIDSPYFLHSMIRVIREMLFLVVIVAICNTPQVYIEKHKPVLVAIAILVLTIFTSVFLQFYFYKYLSSTLFFVPSQFYIAGFATLADTWGTFAEAHGIVVKIRPSSFYAEPSYLGFIILSLATIILRVFYDNKYKKILLSVLFISLLLSQTLSGLVAFGLLLGVFYFKNFSRIHPFILTSIFLLTPVYFLLFPLPELIERLLSFSDRREEVSGFIRLVLPFELISRVLIHSPFGVPQDELLSFLRQPSVGIEPYMLQPSALFGLQLAGLDNAFLNLFIFYGIFGSLIIWVFIRKINEPLLLLYIFLAAMFSGSIFSFDKTVVISMVFLIVSRCSRRNILTVEKVSLVENVGIFSITTISPNK